MTKLESPAEGTIDHPLFVGVIDSSIMLLCGSNPILTIEAARQTAWRINNAADGLAKTIDLQCLEGKAS